MTVRINDVDVDLRFTFNAFIEFERKFSEPLNLDNLTLDKTLWFYYFVVLCSKKGWQTSAWLSKDDFDEWMNDDPKHIFELAKFVQSNLDLNAVLNSDDEKKS